MGPGFSATENTAGATRRPIDLHCERTLVADAPLVPAGAAPAGRASTTVAELLSVDAADTPDAEQGYPWGWKVVYGPARRSGACQTRAQAEREAAVVLALLKGG